MRSPKLPTPAPFISRPLSPRASKAEDPNYFKERYPEPITYHGEQHIFRGNWGNITSRAPDKKGPTPAHIRAYAAEALNVLNGRRSPIPLTGKENSVDFLQGVFGSNVRFMTQGAFGHIYVLDTKNMRANVDVLRSSLWGVVGELPARLPTRICIKLTGKGSDSMETFVDSMRRECYFHGKIQHCLPQNVPKLYFGGLHVPSGVFFMILGLVPNAKALGEVINHSGKVPAHIADQVANIVTSLWKCGFAHNDMHLGNLLYDTVEKKVYLIDFGLAAKIPKKLHEQLVRAMKTLRSPRNAWLSVGNIRRTMNTVFVQRGGEMMTFYNPENRILGVMERNRKNK